MGKSAGASPAPADPVATAQAQTASNEATARTNAALNRVNQTTPYGSLTYQNLGADWASQHTNQMQQAYNAGNYTPGSNNGQFVYQDEYNAALTDPNNPYKDQWGSTVTFSPEQQRLYDQTTAAQTMYGDAALRGLSQLQGKIGSPIDFASAPAAGQAYQQQGQLAPTLTQDAWQAIDPNIGYGAESRARVEDAMFQRLNPSLAAQRASTTQSLANQGLTPGSEAYNNSMRALGQTENDARLGVIAQGGQEEALQAGIANQLFQQKASNRDALLNAQESLFGQQTTARGLFNAEQQTAFDQANQARQNSIQEQLMQRQIPLNELAALLGGQQVQYPQFTGSPATQQANTDVMGAYQLNQQGQQSAYQNRVASANAGNATTAGAVTALAMAAAVA